MSKVNEIDIHIEKAIVTRVSIELKGDRPSYTISGALLTKQGLQVADFTFWDKDGNEWMSDDKLIRIHPTINFMVGDIFRELQPIITEKLNGVFTKLPAPKKGNK